MTTNENINGCDLYKHLGNLEEFLSSRSGTFLFEKGVFPTVPATMATPEIAARKAFKYIDDCYRTEVVHFRASRKTYRQLGLAVLAVVFCPELPELKIELISKGTQIRSIAIRYQGTTSRAVFDYRTQPVSFEYHPDEVHEHPWRDRRPPETGWPQFCLTYQGPEPWKHWDDRDKIEGFGGDDASVLLASLWLDFGREENNQHFVKLETPLQYGGVSKFSPEIQFHLPESETWPT